MARRKKRGRPVSGMLLLDKPAGMTSNAALQKVIRLYRARKGGHTGSLDPLATGMLPICLGEATKLSSWVLDADKRYRVTARLGVATTTGDAEGEVIRECQIPEFDAESLDRVLEGFRGEILQIPPMYSALKHQGRPLYELAREGKVIERTSRPITIGELRVEGLSPDGFTLDVRCSKGTYVRTLVEDIAEAMGCCGHVVELRRHHVEPYAEQPMHTLEALETLAESGFDALDALLLPVDRILAHWPSVALSASDAARVRHGQRLVWGRANGGHRRLYDEEGGFIGIGEVRDGELIPRRLMAQG